MKRYVPGLHGATQNGDSDLEGLFLVRVDRAFYRWHPQKPFFALCLNILEPKQYAGRMISGTALLHTPSSVETQLVPSRLRLRHRSARPGRNR